MNKLFLCSLALGVAASASAADPARSSVEGAPVTLTGCVMASDNDSFVLTHVQSSGDPGAPSSSGAVLGAQGMEPGSGELIYWLSKNSIKKMKGHVGHKVEVTGTITDVSTGTVQIKQDPGKPGPDTKVEVDARGKDASGKTDRPVEAGVPAGVKMNEKKTMPVHRVDVDTVRMVAATCP